MPRAGALATGAVAAAWLIPVIGLAGWSLLAAAALEAQAHAPHATIAGKTPELGKHGETTM